MPRHHLSSAFSRALRRLFPIASNRRARRALRRSQSFARPALEVLESRVLLSSYIVQDLGTLGGAVSEALAMNAKGEVVGVADTASGVAHAVLWSPGKPAQDLGTLGGTRSEALAINDLGEIVGKADTASATNQPFDLLPGQSMTDLTNAPSASQFGATLLTANGVSDTGVIVGKGSFNVIDGYETSPYSYDPPSDTLNQLDNSLATGEATAVAGTRAVANLTTNGKNQAVVADVGTPDSSVALPLLGAGYTASYVTSISAPNGSGTQFATGYETDLQGRGMAVLWTIPTDSHSATVSDLGVYATGFGVNSEGDVVGSYVDTASGDTFGFVDLHGSGLATDPNFLLPPNSSISLRGVNGINDAGQICADGIVNGQEHAFLLTPIPTAPPQVTLTNAPDVNASGDTTYSFVVTYSDDNGIDASTLKNAIQVTGPAGFSQTATLASTSGSATQLAATYTITAPGGTWDFNDDGTYTIALNNNVVKTISGDPLAGGTLGHFVAAINVQRGSISGTVYNDANANSKRDPGEGVLPNTDVFLDLNGDGAFDTGDRLTQTDANGAYSFTGLLPGNYNLLVYTTGLPLRTTDPVSSILVVNVGAGQNLTNVNFGVWTMPQITGIAGQNLVTTHGQTAQFDQPATVLHITGLGFDPGDTFYFGNDQAAAALTNFQTSANNMQTFDLQVSEYATTGPLVVVDHRSNRTITLLPTFTVDSYRNVNGYSFDNSQGLSTNGFSWDELKTVYGGNATDIDFFGIDTGIPDPLAYALLQIINSAWCPPSNGLCVGFSVSSARLMLGLTPSYFNPVPDQIDDFLTTGAGQEGTVWSLANSPDLLELIRLTHLEQTSAEFLHTVVTQVAADELLGVKALIGAVKGELAQGRPIPICLQTPDGGHTVLAYNVQDNANGSETLDIYDPDTEFESSEDNGSPSSSVLGVTNGSFHQSQVNASTIVFGTDGHWVYNGGAGRSTGGLGSIAAVPLSAFANHTLISTLSGLLTLVVGYGSASETQVTDSSGHTLLNADGTPNTNPNTMIPNAARFAADDGEAPLDLINGTGSFMQTLTGAGSGVYGAASFSSNAMATISNESTAAGQTDQFGLDPSTNKLTFAPGTAKNLSADLMINAADGTEYEAQASSNAVGGTQTLQFQGGQVEFQAESGGDTKPTESISLNFGHVNPTAMMMQTFSTGQMKIAAGDTVDLLPSNWNDLQDSTAAVAIHHIDGTTTNLTLQNAAQGYLVNAQEGVAMPTQTVARFTNQTTTGKSAVIDWGDGSTSSGTMTADGADVTVTGAHTYAKQGYYTSRTTLSDASGQIAQTTGEAIVQDAKFSLAPVSIPAFAGVPFSGTVATLTDSPSGDTAGDFGVKINWGDGTTSADTLQTTGPGKFNVIGSHTWTSTGNKSVTVTVTENGSASGQGQTLNIGSNTHFSGTVAQLQLPIPGSTSTDYVASIDWGDSTTSAGTISFDSASGSYLLSGSHTYAAANKSYVTHFTVTGGPSASTTSTAVAGPAVGTVTGTLFDDLNGNGKQDPGEAGIAGQVVYIDLNNDGFLEAGEPSAITNSSGVYTIANAPAGIFSVSEIVPSGFRVAAPASGAYNVLLNAGQTLSNLNFANTQLALISGTVFVDANNNGKLDASESGRANQIVYLDLNNDGVQQATEPAAVTDLTGTFAFTVNAGSYVVRLQSFPTFTITTPAGGMYNVTVGEGGADSSGLFGELLPTTGGGGSGGGGGGGIGPPPPSPKAPPALRTPPLLAFFDSLLAGIETINAETETVTDSIFGIPLFVSLYDGSGNLLSVTIFGIDVTFLFELL